MKTWLLITVAAIATPTNAQSVSLRIEEQRDRAIEAAVATAESRLVRLRYFGDAGDSLGVSGAPVTGWRLDATWVLTSTYGLTRDPAAIVGQSPGRPSAQFELVARDNNRLLALLRLASADPQAPPVIPGSRGARVGETAIALGAVDVADAASVSVGVISAIGRHGGRSMQTDAAISPSNYGGPLIGLDGALLGVIAPLAPAGMGGVDLYDSGIGFAIPPAEFGARLDRMASGESIEPGWLGASFPSSDPLRAAPTLRGVVPEGPAQTAGLAEGDTILTLAAKPTPSVWRLRSVLSGLDAGENVAAEVQRASGTRASLSVRLAERPPQAEPNDQKQEEPDEP